MIDEQTNADVDSDKMRLPASSEMRQMASLAFRLENKVDKLESCLIEVYKTTLQMQNGDLTVQDAASRLFLVIPEDVKDLAQRKSKNEKENHNNESKS